MWYLKWRKPRDSARVVPSGPAQTSTAFLAFQGRGEYRHFVTRNYVEKGMLCLEFYDGRVDRFRLVDVDKVEMTPNSSRPPTHTEPVVLIEKVERVPTPELIEEVRMAGAPGWLLEELQSALTESLTTAGAEHN